MKGKSQQIIAIKLVLLTAFLLAGIVLAGPTATTRAAVATTSPETPKAFSFLLVGDSFMDTYSPVGDFLKKTLSILKDVKVYRWGKVSSGLARPDFFNWNLKAQELMKLYQPNVVIVMLGANDDQPLQIIDKNGQKKSLAFGAAEWQMEYSQRIANFIKIFQQKKAIVFWIGLPVMRDQARANRMKIINTVCQTTINSNFKGAFFIPTWPILANKSGDYVGFLTNQNGQRLATHAPDGIHLSYFAGTTLVKKIIREMASQLPLAWVKQGF